MSLLSVFTEPQKIKAHIDDPEGISLLENKLAEKLKLAKHRPTLLLCIGTDRSTGDALGPLVGTILSRKGLNRLHIMGTLDQPIHAKNLDDTLLYIRRSYNNPYIIGIDACLGKTDSVGFITLTEAPLRPGAGVNKQLPEVGEINITGIVNVGGFMEYMVLQNTRLNLVWQMAEKMSSLFFQAFIKANL